MGTAILVGAVVVLLAAVVLIITLRTRRVRADRDGALLAADRELEAVAKTFKWKLELHPSVSLWYRLRGTSASGMEWEIVEGPPALSAGAVAGGGARWVTEKVRAPQLLLEVLPTILYTRMNAAAQAGSAWDPSWSVATKQLMAAGRVVPFSDPWMAQRLTCVSIIPSSAERLFSAEVVKAIAQLRSSSLRLWLGMPNLRLSVDGGAGTPALLPALVAAGVAIADRYRELEKKSEEPLDS